MREPKTATIKPEAPPREQQVAPGELTAEPPAPDQAIEIPEPSKLHPAAQRTQAKLEAAEHKGPDIVSVGGKGLFRVAASPVQADRVGRLLAALVCAIEVRAWTLRSGDNARQVIVDDEPLAFEMVEQTDRIAHVQTEKETAALKRYEDDRVRGEKAGRYFSTWDRPKVPEWEYVPNGRLTLKFEAGYHHPGLRRSFSDGKQQRLENLLDAIIQAFASYADGEKAWRVEQERRKRWV